MSKHDHIPLSVLPSLPVGNGEINFLQKTGTDDTDVDTNNRPGNLDKNGESETEKDPTG